MSSSHETESWIETWWPLLLMVFAAIMATILASTAAIVK